MKMMYGGVPIKSLNIKHFEMDTNNCSVTPSDLQSGITCFAKGKKMTGTGKCFEFANYGAFETNDFIPVPDNINVIEVACLTNPIQLSVELSKMKNVDFSTVQTIGTVVANGTSYPITVQVLNNILTIGCSTSVRLQVFYGKDNYV